MICSIARSVAGMLMAFALVAFAWGNGSVSGHVYDAKTLAPLTGASVSVNLDCTQLFFRICNTVVQMTSAGDGSFSADDVVPGGGYLDADYALNTANYLPAELPISVAEGQATVEDIYMTPGAVVTGTVTDAATHAPLQGASVVVESQPDGETHGIAVSDASGHFVVDRLVAGTYYIEAAFRSQYLMQYFAGHAIVSPSVGEQPADSITLAAGDVRNDVNFALSKGGTLTGTITDRYTGQPIANAPQIFLRVYGVNGETWYDADAVIATDLDGHYAISGMPATDIRLGAASDQPFYSESLIECSANPCSDDDLGALYHISASTPTNLDFSLFPGSVITGVVKRKSDLQPLAGVDVSVFSPSNSILGHIPYATTVTDTNGHYVISHVSQPSFGVGVVGAAQGSTYYFDQMYNGIDCTHGTCDGLGSVLSPLQDQPANNVNFLLDTGGTIAGKVVDIITGVGIATSMVLQSPDGSYSDHIYSKSDGSFRSMTLASGSYYLFVYAPTDEYVCLIYASIACEDAEPRDVGQPIVISGTNSVENLIVKLPHDVLFLNGFE